MFCPRCGKEWVDNPIFCRNCGAKLVQESVIQSDIKPEIRPIVEPRVDQGIQHRSRSAALKWGTGILFVLTVIYLINVIGSILLFQEGTEVLAFRLGVCFGAFVPCFLVLSAAICAARRKHWRYVLGATISLAVIVILATLFLSAGGSIELLLPAFLFFAEIACLIFISRTKAEFS